MEVVVAMTIVGILTAIAIPSYTAYIARGNRAEARAALVEGANWMERWRTERGRYDDPANANNPPPTIPVGAGPAHRHGQIHRCSRRDARPTTQSP